MEVSGLQDTYNRGFSSFFDSAVRRDCPVPASPQRLGAIIRSAVSSAAVNLSFPCIVSPSRGDRSYFFRDVRAYANGVFRPYVVFQFSARFLRVLNTCLGRFLLQCLNGLYPPKTDRR